MTRYADPQRCPDCLSAIVYGAAACAHCGLPLHGPTAQQLYTTLARADQLLVTLRAPATSTAPLPAAPVLVPPTTTATMPATMTARMSATSVPKILLTLGAGCLLVAALVFLAVTWSVMGVGGRTATLVTFTAIAGGFTGLVAARGLRGAVESLGLVTLGLGALDLVGAWHAGWLGDLSAATFLVVLGAAGVVAAGSACVALRRTPSGAFTAGEVVAGLGTGLAAIGLAAGSWSTPEARALMATLVSLGFAAAMDRIGLAIATVVSGSFVVLSWMALTAVGIHHVGEHPTLAHVWGDLAGWPLLAASLIAAAVAAVPRLPMTARQSVASVAVLVAVLVVVLPSLDEGGTAVSLVALGVLMAASAVLRFVPSPWSAAAGLSAAVAGLFAAGESLVLVLVAGGRLADAAGSPGRFLDRLVATDLDGLLPWVLPLAVAVLALAVVAVERSAVRYLPIVAVVAALATAALYPAPVVLIVATGIVAGGAFLVRGQLITASALLASAVVVGLHSPGLTAVALGAVLLAVAWLLTHHDERVRLAAGVVGQLALAWSLWTWGSLLDRPGEWTAAAGMVLLAGVALTMRNAGLEMGAAAGAVGLFCAGGAVASADGLSSWVAVYLTLMGAAASIQALLRTDRRELGWVGGLLLASATWVRLADVGVHQPEAYTLPSAVALLVVGWSHLRRHPESSTVSALSAGLGLALAPSLLWVLAEPGTLRSVLLGLACLGLVVAGVQLRWTAPLVYAATVGGLVVLRHSAPYIDAGVPRWMLIGLAGVLLVAMGVTWEQRVREARAMAGYLRGLR